MALGLLLSGPVSADVICTDGMRIAVSEDAAAGTLRLSAGDDQLLAFRAVGEADPRWVAGQVTIRRSGEGLLLNGGRYRQLLCGEVPAALAPGVLVGTVSKRDRMALPPGTRIKVILADVSRADAPMREIASTALVTRDNQAPFHFLLRYDPAALDARGTTAVSARVEGPDGRLLYVTDTRVEGPAAGATPTPVELQLVPVRSGA
jgi:putative lipoprotein